MMSCHHATRLLSEMQERELGFKEKINLRMHTFICSACRRFGLHVNTLSLAMRRYAAGVDKDKNKD